jgi:hypothetical protein
MAWDMMGRMWSGESAICQTHGRDDNPRSGPPREVIMRKASVGKVVAGALMAWVLMGCVTVREQVVDDGAQKPAAPSAQPAPPPPPVVESVSVWDDSLVPYGAWVVSGRYGRVWAPSTAVVGAGWRPYTYGHWVLTEYGWTWVDAHPWAYSVHHYGRWAWDPAYGWVWLPDTVWGPGWVAWRTGGVHVGWAPLPPGVVVGTEVYISDGAWVFVHARHMASPGLYRYVAYGPDHQTCLSTTYVYRDVRDIHSHRYDYGPSPRFVSSHGGNTSPARVAELDQGRGPVFSPRSGRREGDSTPTDGHGPARVVGSGSQGGHGPEHVRSAEGGSASGDGSADGRSGAAAGNPADGHGAAHVANPSQGSTPAAPAMREDAPQLERPTGGASVPSSSLGSSELPPPLPPQEPERALEFTPRQPTPYPSERNDTPAPSTTSTSTPSPAAREHTPQKPTEYPNQSEGDRKASSSSTTAAPTANPRRDYSIETPREEVPDPNSGIRPIPDVPEPYDPERTFNWQPVQPEPAPSPLQVPSSGMTAPSKSEAPAWATPSRSSSPQPMPSSTAPTQTMPSPSGSVGKHQAPASSHAPAPAVRVQPEPARTVSPAAPAPSATGTPSQRVPSATAPSSPTVSPAPAKKPTQPSKAAPVKPKAKSVKK